MFPESNCRDIPPPLTDFVAMHEGYRIAPDVGGRQDGATIGIRWKTFAVVESTMHPFFLRSFTPTEHRKDFHPWTLRRSERS